MKASGGVHPRWARWANLITGGYLLIILAICLGPWVLGMAGEPTFIEVFAVYLASPTALLLLALTPLGDGGMGPWAFYPLVAMAALFQALLLRALIRWMGSSLHARKNRSEEAGVPRP